MNNMGRLPGLTGALSVLLVMVLVQPVYARSPENLLARRGMDFLLRVEIDTAMRVFNRLEGKYPSYPLLGFLRGSAFWVKAEAARNQAKKDARAAAVNYLETAITKAEAQLDADPNQPYWQLSLGMSSFFAARIFTDQGRWFRAYRYARKGRDQLRQLIADHPDMDDAYFVLGMYEYVAGSIPRGMRWLAAMLDLRGDRDLGVQYLERATARAPVMAPEAARILLMAAAIQPEVAEPCRYLPLAKYMYKNFTSNPHYSAALQLINVHCGYPGAALQENKRARKAYLERFPDIQYILDLIELQAYRSLGDFKRIEALRQVFEKKDPAFWYLAKAQAYDAAGQRAKALEIYRSLEEAGLDEEQSMFDSQPPDWVLDQVEIYLKTPYQRPEPVVVDERTALRLHVPDGSTYAMSKKRARQGGRDR